MIVGTVVFFALCTPTLFYPNQNKHVMPLALIKRNEAGVAEWARLPIRQIDRLLMYRRLEPNNSNM